MRPLVQILLLLCVVPFFLAEELEVTGKQQCSAHFNGSSHLVVERFVDYHTFKQGVSVNSMVVMLNIMVTPRSPSLWSSIESAVLLNTGIVPGKSFHFAYVLKYNYFTNSVELEEWHRTPQGSFWSLTTYTHPLLVPYFQWVQITFTKSILLVRGEPLDLFSGEIIQMDPNVVEKVSPPFFFSIGRNFTGYIDEVMVWDSLDYKLSPCQRTAESTMLLWLPFNECQGTVAADLGSSSACSRSRNSESSCSNFKHKNGIHERPSREEEKEKRIFPTPFWLKNADLADTEVNLWEVFHTPQEGNGGNANSPSTNEGSHRTNHVRHGWRKHKFGYANNPISWGYSVLFWNENCPNHASTSQVEAQCPYLKDNSGEIGGHDGHDNHPFDPVSSESEGYPDSGDDDYDSDSESEGGFVGHLFWLFIFGLSLIGCMCCCVRRRRNANCQAYKQVSQVDAETQAGPPFYYDQDEYEMNVGYPGSYIPDMVQMRSDAHDSPYAEAENMMAPMMVHPVPGQPQGGYPQYMMPNMFYTAPYLPQVHPWQVLVYPDDVDSAQIVPDEEQKQ